MSRARLTLALLVLACGDDAVSPETGTTADEGSTTDSPTTTGMPTTSSASATMTTTTPGTSSSGEETTSSSSGEAESSTTMAEPACGDGNRDPGEECDDGNLDQDDDCTAMCTTPFTDEWTVSYNGPASNFDGAAAVVVDGEGNIIVAGSHRTISDGFDVWVQQYAPDGTEMWNFTWDGGVALNDGANGIALHPSGDLIIAGYTETVLDDDDVLLMRVAVGDSLPMWIAEPYDGSGTGKEDFQNGDYGTGVVVDGNGDIVVVGNIRVDAEGANVYVRKHDPADGAEIWLQTYNGAVSQNEFCRDAVVDAADNIIVLCTSREVSNVDTGWVRMYDADGMDVWTQEIAVFPNGMTLDGDGNILITGFADVGTIDILVNKYDPDFAEIWSVTVNGPSAGSDFGHEITTDAAGNVYVVGDVAVTGQQDDAYVHKFDPDGNDLWAHSYNNEEASLNDSLEDVAVDGDGNVYVVGQETVLGQQGNAWIRKLVQL